MLLNYEPNTCIIRPSPNFELWVSDSSSKQPFAKKNDNRVMLEKGKKYGIHQCKKKWGIIVLGYHKPYTRPAAIEILIGSPEINGGLQPQGTRLPPIRRLFSPFVVLLGGAAAANLRESQISRLPFAVPLKLSCMPAHLISCHHS